MDRDTAVSLKAQGTPSGTLSGNATDPTGAIVPNAALERTNTATHRHYKTTSNAEGRFLFTLVPPGVYDLNGCQRLRAPHSTF